MSDGLKPFIQIIELLFVVPGGEGLVFIEEVIIPVACRCDVGHQYVGADTNRLFPSSLVNGLKGRGSGDVDVRHQDAQQGDHP